MPSFSKMINHISKKKLSIIPGLFLLFSTVLHAQTSTVRFEFNRIALTPETRSALDKLVASNKIRSLGIFGHTDQMGSDLYNEWLSVQRALEVKKYLLENGVKEGDISVVLGFGANNLISSSNDEMARQLNRRVVLSIGYEPTAMEKERSVRQAQLPNPGEDVVLGADGTVVVHKPRVAPMQPATKVMPVVKQQQNEKLVEDIKDKRTKAGENIVLKNINFYEGSHEFLPSARPALQDLLETMQKIPSLEIEIQGHVCCQEGDSDALDNATGEPFLSINRAKAVYEFLIENGINKKRLSYIGLAHQYPLIKMELSEADKITNRRVEIKIIKK
jgi:outer membrane protein OmpA-like peptidoglycan-associated protein